MLRSHSPFPGISYDARGNAEDYCICWYIPRHDGTSSDERPDANRDATHYRTVAAE